MLFVCFLNKEPISVVMILEFGYVHIVYGCFILQCQNWVVGMQVGLNTGVFSIKHAQESILILTTPQRGKYCSRDHTVCKAEDSYHSFLSLHSQCKINLSQMLGKRAVSHLNLQLGCSPTVMFLEWTHCTNKIVFKCLVSFWRYVYLSG